MKKKYQLDLNSIKILAKENIDWKCRLIEAYFSTERKDKAPHLIKTNVRLYHKECRYIVTVVSSEKMRRLPFECLGLSYFNV